MTATATVRTASPTSRPEVPRIHPALSLALILTPVIHLVAIGFAPAFKGTGAAQLAVVAAHPTRWYVYTLLMVIGGVIVIPAAIAMLMLARDGMRRVGTIGGVLVTLGFVGSIVDCANQFWAWQMIHGGDRGQMAALLDRFDNSAATNLPFAVTGIGLLVGTVLTTVALVRNPAVPSWAALAYGIAVAVNIVGFSNNSVPIVAVSFGVLLVGMGGIGVSSLRHQAPVSQ